MQLSSLFENDPLEAKRGTSAEPLDDPTELVRDTLFVKLVAMLFKPLVPNDSCLLLFDCCVFKA